jgi:heat shock protein HslJ
MKKYTFLLSLFVSFAWSGGLKAQTLTGTKWRLKAIYDETHQNLLTDTLMKGNIYFKTDSTYEGHFCNSYYGKYRSENTKSLLMKRPMATRKFCAGGYSELETRLYSYYSSANIYIREGDELSLISDKGKLVFTRQ